VRPKIFLSLVAGGARKDSIDSFREILSFFSVFFRDLMASGSGETVTLLNSDLRGELASLTGTISEVKAARGVKLIEDYLGSLKKNPNLSIMSNELVIFFREINYV